MTIDVMQLRPALEQLRTDGHLDELKSALLRVGREALESENDPDTQHATAELCRTSRSSGSRAG